MQPDEQDLFSGFSENISELIEGFSGEPSGTNPEPQSRRGRRRSRPEPSELPEIPALGPEEIHLPNIREEEKKGPRGSSFFSHFHDIFSSESFEPLEPRIDSPLIPGEYLRNTHLSEMMRRHSFRAANDYSLLQSSGSRRKYQSLLEEIKSEDQCTVLRALSNLSSELALTQESSGLMHLFSEFVEPLINCIQTSGPSEMVINSTTIVKP